MVYVPTIKINQLKVNIRTMNGWYGKSCNSFIQHTLKESFTWGYSLFRSLKGDITVRTIESVNGW